MYILGIDDAGRGPIIGPMYLAGVLVRINAEAALKELGAADSKTLTHSKRISLAKLIRDAAEAYEVIESTPAEIDRAVESINLNTLEAQKAASIINRIHEKFPTSPITVIVDCPSVNTESWKKTMSSYIANLDHLTIRCEHKADFNYPVAGAASILAKVAREDAVTAIKAEYAYLGDIGSGYPSDPVTKAFLKKHHTKLTDSGIIRTSWATWKALVPSKTQASLKDF